MTIQAELTGQLTVSEDGVTLTQRLLSLTQSSLDDYKRRQRLSVAEGATETVTIPATDGRVLAVFLRSGGPITLLVGAASGIPIEDFLIMDSPGFTALSVTASATAEVEVLVGGTD